MCALLEACTAQRAPRARTTCAAHETWTSIWPKHAAATLCEPDTHRESARRANASTLPSRCTRRLNGVRASERALTLCVAAAALVGARAHACTHAQTHARAQTHAHACPSCRRAQTHTHTRTHSPMRLPLCNERRSRHAAGERSLMRRLAARFNSQLQTTTTTTTTQMARDAIVSEPPTSLRAGRRPSAAPPLFRRTPLAIFVSDVLDFTPIYTWISIIATCRLK